ncbi:MAG: hypothetical protein K2X93_07780 [Candidatus Obscuribacterales bacterium]|nr:hypothetical protein [Candidatus Obscuribacterales bacterium]
MNDAQMVKGPFCSRWELLKKIEFLPRLFWESDAESLVRHLLESEAIATRSLLAREEETIVLA